MKYLISILLINTLLLSSCGGGGGSDSGDNSDRLTVADAIAGISDKNFADCLTATLTSTYAGEVISINCEWSEIKDTDGLEMFVGIKELYLNNNLISNIDVSANTSLTHLNLRFNYLTGIDVSANTALIHLDLQVNSLTSIDLSANTELEMLFLDANKLTSIC